MLVLWISLGAALGSCLRWATALTAQYLIGSAIWGTFLVNIGGGFAAGYLSQVLEKPSWQAFLLIGFLGALTTLSTLNLETLRLYKSLGFTMAACYAIGTLSLSLAAAASGIWLASK